MSRKDNLVKSKSIYTLRSKHTTIPNGTIFENDHVTIISNDGIYDEDMPLFSDSNFKFRIGLHDNGRRKHSRGGFVSVDDTSNVWTLMNLPETNPATDGRIFLKPNYSSIKEFAYYGSAVELLRATVNDIIFRYPGGLYYYPENVSPSMRLDAGFGVKSYYLVSNEFNIDFWTPMGCSTDDLDNPLRVLGASYMHYVDGEGNPIALNACITGYCLNSVIGRVSFVNVNGRQNSESDEILGSVNFYDDSDASDRSSQPSSNLYYLQVTAETITNGAAPVPIANKSVTFIGVTTKGVTLTGGPITTDADGAAGIYVPAHENGQWVGNAAPNDILTWTAYLNYNGRTYYNTHGSRNVLNGETEDTIVAEINTMNFPLVVSVIECDTKEPIEGAVVKFYMKTNHGSGILVKTTPTDSSGYAYFYESDYTDVQSLFNGETPTFWYSDVTFNGETHITNTYSLTGSTYGYTCFVIDDFTPAFLNCSITGLFTNNSNIGPGSYACLNFYDVNGEKYVMTGYTDSNGTFTVSEEEFHGIFSEVIPVKANGEITYNGITKVSTFVFIFESSTNPQNYNLTVYFSEEPTYNTKTLLCDVYEVGYSNRPIQGVDIKFTVITDKSQYVFNATGTSNSYGIAGVDIPSDVWVGNGTQNELVLDGNDWTVEYYDNNTNTRYTGVLGTLHIKNGQLRNRIEIQPVMNWTGITVYATNGSSMLQNVMCTVCASTKSCGNYWYYANGVTDSSGKFVVGNNPSEWHHFNGTPTAVPNDFLLWKASSAYHGDMPDNPMEFCFALREIPDFTSGYEYTFIFEDGNELPPVGISCDKIMDDDNSFPIYLDGNGNMLLLTDKNGPVNGNSVIIEPKKEFFDEFWNTIDDFERVLLNRNSKPLYRSFLETPYIENEEHYYDYRPYVWPTVNGYVPDMTTGAFNGYLNGLMAIAEYYDEYDSDNLWRMMTHDSIKNLDESGMIYSDDDSVDLTRMEAMIRIHGRIYDDIKRYADGIKYVNRITYDEKNNLPDYFLSDNVDIGGFEVKSINEFQKEEDVNNTTQIITSDNVFTGSMLSGITAFEINGEFLRRLSLSEDYILSTKGTRRGIEYILGMFGYRYRNSDGKDYEGNNICLGDYDMSEYIRVANRFPLYIDLTGLRVMGNYTHNDVPGENVMDGYPINVVAPENSEGEFDYYTIPWVVNGENYVNDIYFQEKGGWGRIPRKNVNLEITTASLINEDSGFTIYGETAPYLMYVNDLDELTDLSNTIVYDGLICYVTDISGLYTSYSAESDYNNSIIIGGETAQTQGDETRGSSDDPSMINQSQLYRDYSHYFVLVNAALSTHVGYVKNNLYSCYGWRNILLREFENGPITYDGLKVIYLESLELETKGNNPHCGYGNYDDGNSYIEKLNRLFGSAIENGDFDDVKDNPDLQEEYNEICTVGFNIGDLVEDNEKCYYFENGESEIVDRTSTEPMGTNHVSVDVYGNTYELVQILEGNEEVDAIDTTKYDNFVNPEGGNKTEECASFSVVNVKNFVIRFYTGGNQYFEKYLETVVFKYLREMIPSTTILEFKFMDNCNGLGNHNVVEWDENNQNGIVDDEVVGDSVSVSNGDVTYLIENNEGIV